MSDYVYICDCCELADAGEDNYDGDSGRVMCSDCWCFCGTEGPDSFDAVTHKALAKAWA
jgi:hypothetical protein